MDESGKTPIEHFIIQRRNLIIISILSIFLTSAKISFPKINIFGTVINIDNPQIIPKYIIIFLLYFLWRYNSSCNHQAIRGVRNFIGNFLDKGLKLGREKAIKIMAKRMKIPLNKISMTNRGDMQESSLSGHTIFYINRLEIDGPLTPEQKEKAIDISLSFLHRMKIHIRVLIKMISLEIEFAEYILPYLIAIYAFFQLTYFIFNENAERNPQFCILFYT